MEARSYLLNQVRNRGQTTIEGTGNNVVCPLLSEVIDVSATGKTVNVRELAQDSVPGSEGFMCEQRVPVPGHCIGEPTRKIVRPGYGSGGDFVPMKHGSATPWSGTPCYCSWYA